MYDIEKEFNSYLTYKVEIDNYKLEIEELIKNNDSTGGVCYEERTAPTNKTSNVVQDKFFSREDKYIKYEKEMDKLQYKVDKMVNATKLLAELEKEIIELCYFTTPTLSKKQIETKVCLSRNAVYKIKRRALRKMEVCFSR